ncbi:glycoside hydrolase family 32 protein [Pedococcus sp. 5OH_020]|uniref:glycoside hydrolase family 32 protein n=1 Tax=Pedococcus sp. 5OH_020 TaxID=2989814 RepID=UPI0022E9B1D9|nr:glycoside hydrolase family 32 protein [Pedococcus sp. 5OH_020]
MTGADAVPGARNRPAVHFTAQEGWINDPFGIGWHNGTYHLYYQAVPGQVVWGPNCHWGRATSPDLVHWTEQPMALVPEPFEVGCWSGSVVYDGDAPELFYTRVGGGNWAIGQVAHATVDESCPGRWKSLPSDVLIAGPPPGVQATSYRDPFIFRRDEGDWGMLMGAALADGTAAALHYHSADLREWTYDGILCARRSTRADEVWTGTLWECPQLFRLDDQWVLLISVWEDDELYHVVAATGDYDGSRFTPRRWQRLTHGESAYAMAAFQDRNGMRCVMSWLREEPRNNERLVQRAGAHSVAAVVEFDVAGNLVLRPHPDVDALRGPVQTGHASPQGTSYDWEGAAVHLQMSTAESGHISMLDGDHERAFLDLDAHSGALVISRPGFGKDETLPVPTDGADVTVLLDGDIVEVFSAAGYGAYRVPATAPGHAGTLRFTGPATAEPVVRPLQLQPRTTDTARSVP